MNISDVVSLDRFIKAAVTTVFGSLLIFYNPAWVFGQEAEVTIDPVAIFNRAQDLHEKGDLRGAVGLYEQALKEFPDFPEAEYQRGAAYLALKDLNSAEKAFRQAVKLRPGWPVAINSLSSVLIERGELREASSLVQQVLDVDHLNPQALTALADLRLRTDSSPAELKDLLSKITQLTSKANLTLSLWTAKAALETALHLNDAAKNSLVKALSLEPANPAALSMLGELSLLAGDIEKARELADRIEKANAEYASGIVLRARVLAFDGRYDEASALLGRVRVDVPGVSELRNHINIWRTATPAALEALLKGNERDPALLGRLCSLYRKDDPAKALEYCRRASAVEPDNMAHAVGYGAALVQAKQFEPAVGLLSKIVGIVPDNSTARANLATALFQLKRYSEAKIQFAWLSKTQPESAGAYYFLGIIHDQLSEYLDAAANYKQYIKLADPIINKTDIERVNLRLPQVLKMIGEGKGKKPDK
jgi:tetratricopeptide (TPR) repeat protein